jgi:hypothetical protein
MSNLRAGAGRARIVLPGGLFPADHLGGEHHPLRVRVLLLRGGADPIVVAVVDATPIPAATPAGVAKVLGHVTHVPPERVLVCAGPEPDGDAPEPGLQHAVEDAVAWAAFAARSTCRPARLGTPAAGARRIDDIDGHPIALLLSHPAVASTADALEQAHHNEPVALFLTETVAAELAGVL